MRGVKRFDGVTGAFIDTFVPNHSGGLDDPNFITFIETDPVTLAYPSAVTSSAVSRQGPRVRWSPSHARNPRG